MMIKAQSKRERERERWNVEGMVQVQIGWPGQTSLKRWNE